MSRYRLTALAVGILLAGSIGTTDALAGTSYEFLFSVNHASNDTELFLNLAVGNAGYSRAVIEPIVPRLQVVETDLPVVLFLARQCQCSLPTIMGLRADGLSWSVIFGRVGVPIDVLFVGIPRDPGPPYGKAWGHWKKRGARSKLSDEQIASLSRLQIGQRVTGVSTFDLARSCTDGRTVVNVVAERKGKKGGDQGDHGKKSGKGGGKGDRHGS